MPARTTIISSISKRTDEGHRMLSANEFLQMSGRAGRRGMDEIGYVVIIGTPFQTPEEVATLATSDSNPLESKFSPCYSMVLNLLQRFSLEEAKELILKTFGYYSSTDRISPLLLQMEEYQNVVDAAKAYKCPRGLKNEDFFEYNKLKNIYVETRTIYKTLKRQAKQKNRKDAPEVAEFAKKASDLFRKIEHFGCDNCKLYKKHKKEIELLARYEKKMRQLKKEIEFQKDVYWQKFLAHKAILEQTDNLVDDFPTERGKVTMTLRTENELYLSEIILSGILNELNPAELASVICAIACEEVRTKDDCVTNPPCKNVRKVLNKIKDIKRQIYILERDYHIENQMNLHSHFCALIEYWVNSDFEDNNDIATWEQMFSESEFSQGDVVRAFKRTIDILRQITTIEGISSELIENAKKAIRSINREPVNVD